MPSDIQRQLDEWATPNIHHGRHANKRALEMLMRDVRTPAKKVWVPNGN